MNTPSIRSPRGSGSRPCRDFCAIALLFPFLFIFTFSATAFAKPTEGTPPNIILFLADDLGWNGLGCYGSDLHETPHLDALAAGGMKFLDAYSACTVCSPTRAAAMTGMYPARLRVTNWIPGTKMPNARLKEPDWTMHLDPRHVTLAEVLTEAGYRTAHIGKWHLGASEFLPEHQGFQKNIGGTSTGSPPGGYFLPNKLDLPKAKEGEYLTDHLTDRALELIDGWKDEAFFLYFAFYNVHTPIQGKPDLVDYYQKKIDSRTSGEALMHANPVYAAMVHSVDENVGRVLAKLDELNLSDNTVILFTSDNGGLSHKQGVPTGITLNDPLRRGKGSAYEGGTRVPLIVKWPGVTKPGAITTEPACTVDFYPTILDIVGVKGDPEHNALVDGLSLVPVLKNADARLDRENLYWHFPHYHAGGDSPYGAIRSRDWKLVEFYEDKRVELYNLKEDLGESTDVAGEHPEKVEALRQQLHDWRLAVAAQMPVSNPEYDPEKAREGARGKKKEPE